jgi:hypothetical protein
MEFLKKRNGCLAEKAVAAGLDRVAATVRWKTATTATNSSGDEDAALHPRRCVWRSGEGREGEG